jgi:hypothetical protein
MDFGIPPRIGEGSRSRLTETAGVWGGEVWKMRAAKSPSTGDAHPSLLSTSVNMEDCVLLMSTMLMNPVVVSGGVRVRCTPSSSSSKQSSSITQSSSSLYHVGSRSNMSPHASSRFAKVSSALLTTAGVGEAGRMSQLIFPGVARLVELTVTSFFTVIGDAALWSLTPALTPALARIVVIASCVSCCPRLPAPEHTLVCVCEHYSVAASCDPIFNDDFCQFCGPVV